MAGLTKATGPIGLRMILFLAELERVRRTYHPSPEERSMTTYHPDPNDPDDDDPEEEDLPPKPPIEDQLPEEGIDPYDDEDDVPAEAFLPETDADADDTVDNREDDDV